MEEAENDKKGGSIKFLSSGALYNLFVMVISVGIPIVEIHQIVPNICTVYYWYMLYQSLTKAKYTYASVVSTKASDLQEDPYL